MNYFICIASLIYYSTSLFTNVKWTWNDPSEDIDTTIPHKLESTDRDNTEDETHVLLRQGSI